MASVIVTIKASAPVVVISERISEDGRERFHNGEDRLEAGQQRDLLMDQGQSLRMVMVDVEAEAAAQAELDAINAEASRKADEAAAAAQAAAAEAAAKANALAPAAAPAVKTVAKKEGA